MNNPLKLLVLACACAAVWASAGPGLLAAKAAGVALADLPPAAPPLRPGDKVAFLELGSVGCKPCDAMKPVMDAVRAKYGERVEVVFYDVRKDSTPAREHRIRLIPTQVFLMPDGSEFFRHEGYFPLEEIEAVLVRMGVR